MPPSDAALVAARTILDENAMDDGDGEPLPPGETMLGEAFDVFAKKATDEFGKKVEAWIARRDIGRNLHPAMVGLLEKYLAADLETCKDWTHTVNTGGGIRRVQPEIKEPETVESQPSRPPIVCLCGSTRFYSDFQLANLRETLAGKIVLSIGCDFKSDQALGLAPEVKDRLDLLHLRKIELSDEVLILNVAGYVGPSTGREIEHARKLGKAVRFLEPEKRLEETK